MSRNRRFVGAIATGVAVARGVFSRHEKLFWAAAIAVVAVVQWPMVKGLYYRAAATPPPPSSIEWRTDLNAALEEARRTRKPVLVDISADWCPPCIAMKHDVWPDPAVARTVAQSYVPVLIDADRDVTVMDRYGIRAIPAILIVDDRGKVIRRATFLSASGMAEFLANTSTELLLPQSRSQLLKESRLVAMAHVNDSVAESARLEELEMPSQGGPERRLAAADDHRVEEQVTFVDEIGFERKPGKLRAANADLVLRFPLQPPNRLEVSSST